MDMLRKEWTKEEIEKLDSDLKTAKVKVLNDWGFSAEVIAKIIDLPCSTILHMLSE